MDTIYEIYERRRTKDTHKRVLERINMYMRKNIASVTDGLYKNVPVVAGDVIDFIAQPYGLTDSDWKEITKSRQFSIVRVRRLASPLKLGLLISYCDTKDMAFLTFLSILIYSSLMYKYFPKGFDKNIMKYTIDNADSRTDFKKFESLMMVIDKKLQPYLRMFDRKLKPKVSDKDLREALESLMTRLNEAVKAISTKYYQNFNDPDIKIMMQYTKTDDGKNILSALGVMEAIRQAAVDNLAAPSDKILSMIRLSVRDTQNIKYRKLIVEQMPDCFGLLSSCTSEMLDDWMRRNPDKVTVTLFRKDFVKTMSKARNVQKITAILESVNDKMLSSLPDEEIGNYDRLTLRRFMYNYVMLNIYASSIEIIN